MLALKNKILLVSILTLVALTVMALPIASVSAQSETKISSVTAGPAGSTVNVNVQGSIATSNGRYLIFFNGDRANPVVNATASQNTVNVDFAIQPTNALVAPGDYTVTLQDVTAAQTNATGAENTRTFHIGAEGIAAIPIATLLIMLVAVSISFINMIVNRALITKMIGWHEYRSMQKEISEYNAQRMAAMRAGDQKTLERLKKKESQINAMQTKMFKPQLILLPIGFVYFIFWPVLTGFFPYAVAFVPGLGPQPFFIWYLICSFFFGTIASRIIGVTPIQ
jgi:uncharacterized membrane protein (DUF106 family)